MSIINNPFLLKTGQELPEIGHSLRFNSADSAYMGWTPGSAGNQKTFTLSFWVKRSALGVREEIFSVGTGALTGGYFTVFFNTDDKLNIYDAYPSVPTNQLIWTSSAVFRDVSSHYHILIRIDTTHADSGYRCLVYVNNVFQGYSVYSPVPTQNANMQANRTIAHAIGRFNGNNSGYFSGYLSRICFVDGTAGYANNFAYIDLNGQWRSKSAKDCKAVVDAGGTNSFMLDFEDGTSTTTLGNDYSSKNNDWTLTNFTRSAGVNDDWMEDTPTNNFSVLNWLNNTGGVIQNGALTVITATSAASSSYSTFNIPTTGKWYWEFVYTAGAYCFSGVGKPLSPSTYCVYYTSGQKYINGTGSAYGTSYTLNDFIGVAVDSDVGTITFYKNGVSQGAISIDFSDGDYAVCLSDGSSSDGTTQHINFGQRPFNYTPPTGFKSLCTKNLPTPSIVRSEQHFDVKLDTGANIKTTSEATFPSFLEWIKDRANTNNHQLIDSVRGSSVVLQSSTTAAETTYSVPSGSSVGWVWRASGAGVSNTDGSITSTVSANQTAGFSIVTYTGTGANATVGHGLGVAPRMVITKFRGTISNWIVGHASIGWTEAINLDATLAKTTTSTAWNNTPPTSSVFSIGTYYANGSNNVAYCFAEIPGYSKISSYIGNGSTNGPFIHCGFRPKFVMIKRTDSTGSWQIFDSARLGYNVDNDQLVANTSAAEVTTDLLDIVSNGFKIRSTSTEVNTNNGIYIFVAFAESPFKYANAR